VTAHLDRTVAAMDAAGLDALLLGRPGNVRYVSEAATLWLAGQRPWAPTGVVVREPAAVHLLATSDAGVPPSIPRDHLFPITWNPPILLGALAAIPGVAGARRIGTDGMTPLFAEMLAGALPGAALVDGEAMMRDVRKVKSADDLDGVRAAASVCRIAFAAMVDGLAAGASPAQLRGRFLAAMCLQGVTTPAVDPRVTPIGDGTLHLDAGVTRAGWEVGVARTLAPGAVDAPGAWTARRDVVAEGIVPGRRVGDLRGDGVAVDGLGLGLELLDDADVVEPNMVLDVTVETGGISGRDTVVVTDAGSEVLTA
jgi:Xaa-Pro dipeptidase